MSVVIRDSFDGGDDADGGGGGHGDSYLFGQNNSILRI